MGIFDFVKKKKGNQANDAGKSVNNQKDDNITSEVDADIVTETPAAKPNLKDMMGNVDMSKMTTMQKMAFKMFQRMSPQKQEEILRQAMNPQNVQKNKGQILKQIDEMVKSGQIDKGQAEAIKSQMGLR